MKKIIILCLLIGAAAVTPLFAQNKWRRYDNVRFGYSISYPSDLLAAQGEPDNGDGQIFSGGEEAEMRVYASFLLLNKTLLKEYNAAVKKHENVSYKLYRKNFFVVSSSQNGRVYYRKTMMKSGAFVTFSIEYDESKRAVFDQITARISNSLK